MKNKHGYDHSTAIQPNTEVAYDKGFADGMQGAECFPEGSELYREGWQHGREMYHIEKYDEGYWAGRLHTRALTDWPNYLTNCPHFVRGWHKGAAARQHPQPTR